MTKLEVLEYARMGAVGKIETQCDLIATSGATPSKIRSLKNLISDYETIVEEIKEENRKEDEDNAE